jgi:hypothetical protein
MRSMTPNPSGNGAPKSRPGSFVNLGGTALRAVISIGTAGATLDFTQPISNKRKGA